MITFPLFVMWKDGGYFGLIDNFESVINEVEENDIHSEEFFLWDSEGHPLEYGEHPTDLIWLKESDAAAPNLATQINEQLASRELTLRVCDKDQFTEAVKLLMVRQQQDDRGLIAMSRKIISWLSPKKSRREFSA